MEIIILFGGIILTSIFIFLVVRNQYKQFKIICNAKDITFDPILIKSNTYPEDLKKIINSTNENLNTNQETLSKYLIFFQILSWIPSVIAFAITSYKIYHIVIN